MNWEVVSENIIDQINQHFYMDNFLSFHSRIERLSSTAKIIIKVLSNGSFRLTKVETYLLSVKPINKVFEDSSPPYWYANTIHIRA